ncbi:hypothetical protein SMD44_08917 [Streptomyces alboflavus]|uniref:Uncharacterized protein n=1 Tax=Streptomyces alboflavus TaxID=67267 RepID=A0A1Z1WSK9_9ACTN|nr:hypothetical protein SMD44_08917 [Streptomyces alboflavus]
MRGGMDAELGVGQVELKHAEVIGHLLGGGQVTGELIGDGVQRRQRRVASGPRPLVRHGGIRGSVRGECQQQVPLGTEALREGRRGDSRFGADMRQGEPAGAVGADGTPGGGEDVGVAGGAWSWHGFLLP